MNPRVESFEEQIARLTAAIANEITRANLAEEVARKERDRAEQATIRAEHLADRLRSLGQDPDA